MHTIEKKINMGKPYNAGQNWTYGLGKNMMLKYENIDLETSFLSILP